MVISDGIQQGMLCHGLQIDLSICPKIELIWNLYNLGNFWNTGQHCRTSKDIVWFAKTYFSSIFKKVKKRKNLAIFFKHFYNNKSTYRKAYDDKTHLSHVFVGLELESPRSATVSGNRKKKCTGGWIERKKSKQCKRRSNFNSNYFQIIKIIISQNPNHSKKILTPNYLKII